MGFISRHTTQLVINNLGADTRTRKHAYRRSAQDQFKKPGAAPGFKIWAVVIICIFLFFIFIAHPFMGFRFVVNVFLYHARAGLIDARLVLKIDPVLIVGMRVCVCVRPRGY